MIPATGDVVRGLLAIRESTNAMTNSFLVNVAILLFFAALVAHLHLFVKRPYVLYGVPYYRVQLCPSSLVCYAHDTL